MQITFAGTIIGQEPPQGGFDSISGFMPSGKQQTQIAEFLRGMWATPYARGNRVHTLKGRIIRKTATTLSTALAARMVLYTNLPTSGPLIFQEGSAIVTFATAVLESFAPVEDQTRGISYGFELTFVAGVAVGTTTPLLSEAGKPILAENSNPIYGT